MCVTCSVVLADAMLTNPGQWSWSCPRWTRHHLMSCSSKEARVSQTSSLDVNYICWGLFVLVAEGNFKWNMGGWVREGETGLPDNLGQSIIELHFWTPSYLRYSIWDASCGSRIVCVDCNKPTQANLVVLWVCVYVCLYIFGSLQEWKAGNYILCLDSCSLTTKCWCSHEIKS